MRIFFIILTATLFLSACQSAKDAMTLKKKSSGDEFLVEKKSPLVLPPDYGELPLPGQTNIKKENDQNNELQVTIGDIKIPKSEQTKDTEPTSIEESVLKKIK